MGAQRWVSVGAFEIRVSTVDVRAVSPTPGADGALSTAFFVDQGTTVAVPAQDGSIGAPFATIQTAIDAVAALPPGTPGTVLVVPGYSGTETLSMTPGNLTIAPLAGLARPAYNTSFASPIVVGDIDIPVGGSSVLKLCGVLALYGSVTFAEDATLYVGAGCVLGDVVCTTPSGGILVLASDCSIQSVASCADLSSFNNVQLNAAVGKVLTSLGTRIRLLNCAFDPVAVLEIEFLGAAGSLELDAVSNFFWKAATETLTNGVKVIIGDLA